MSFLASYQLSVITVLLPAPPLKTGCLIDGLEDKDPEAVAESVSVCVERWRNAGPDARKKMFVLFKITGIFSKPDPSRFPKSAQEGGYPDLGDYN